MYKNKYCSALRRKEILTFVTTWMNLEVIMLNEINQTQKDKPVWYCLNVKSKKKKLNS